MNFCQLLLFLFCCQSRLPFAAPKPKDKDDNGPPGSSELVSDLTELILSVGEGNQALVPPPPAEINLSFQEELIVEELEAKCRGNSGKECKIKPKDKEDNKKTRDQVKKLKSEAKQERGRSKSKAEKSAEEEIRLTLKVKELALEAIGLDPKTIEVADDGLLAGDVTLNKGRALALIREFTKKKNKNKNKRERREILTLELYPSLKWAMPIHYVIGRFITSAEAQIIEDAIKVLSNAVVRNCVRFRRENSWNGPHLYFRKLNSDKYCGSSPVGPISVNDIYINFNVSICRPKGTIWHEIMHSLGAHHEHVRLDRYNHTEVIWRNVRPDKIDLFLPGFYSSQSNTYAVPYNHMSVMHYSAFVAVVSKGQPNMMPIDTKILVSDMGQRNELPSTDVELIKKAYCCPNDCNDYDKDCGFFALSRFCQHHIWGPWTRYYCRKSCRLCCK